MSQPFAIIAFDFRLMRPGCVLLQRLFGGMTQDGKNPAHDFPVDSWLLAPTPDLKPYAIRDEEQYKNIVDNYDLLREHRSKNPLPASP